jgi:phosphoglucomutase
MGIVFGTSGWRAIIADEFTVANVRLVTEAIVAEFEAQGADPARGLVIGYDTRFLSERFAAECAAELGRLGWMGYLTTRETPTPTLSYAIRTQQAVGGINFTASHNPAQYNGMKLSTSDGAPALPELTRAVEARIGQLMAMEGADARRRAASRSAVVGKTVMHDPRRTYLEDLTTKIDFATIAGAHLRLAYDPLWGTGRGYVDTILREQGCEVLTVHDERDVLFGGNSPEPSERNLAEMRALILEEKLALGVATDGDADRFGFIDRDGSFLSANHILALVFDYLCQTRPTLAGGVARSVATTHLLDRLARHYGRELYETPVGFKYIGEMIIEDRLLLGGEESAGMTIKGHLPEKDGILACLLVVEMMAARQASLGEMIEDLFHRHGALYSERVGVRLTPEVQARLSARLAADPPTKIGAWQVVDVNRADGVKYLFEDGSWLLLRLSGTEPVVRCYAESHSKKDLEVLLETGSQFVRQ